MSKTVGNYSIESKVGAGNYATVFKAVHKISHEVFAIKMIAKEKLGNDQRLYANLESEIMIMRNYIHPNVVRLFENLTSGRNIYLVLEYCPGGDLFRFIRKHKHLSDIVAKHFFVQLVDGLAFLHSKNVVHRDIKPQNLLLSEFSDKAIIKIADFGFAKSLTEAAMASTQCGTPLYMAPEIFQMKEYDESADIWSLGCVYYEMLVGRTPFTGSSPKELYTNIQTKSLTIPSEIVVPMDTQMLLKQLLERDPLNRSPLADIQKICMSLSQVLKSSGYGIDVDASASHITENRQSVDSHQSNLNIGNNSAGGDTVNNASSEHTNNGIQCNDNPNDALNRQSRHGQKSEEEHKLQTEVSHGPQTQPAIDARQHQDDTVQSPMDDGPSVEPVNHIMNQLRPSPNPSPGSSRNAEGYPIQTQGQLRINSAGGNYKAGIVTAPLYATNTSPFTTTNGNLYSNSPSFHIKTSSNPPDRVPNTMASNDAPGSFPGSLGQTPQGQRQRLQSADHIQIQDKYTRMAALMNPTNETFQKVNTNSSNTATPGVSSSYTVSSNRQRSYTSDVVAPFPNTDNKMPISHMQHSNSNAYQSNPTPPPSNEYLSNSSEEFVMIDGDTLSPHNSNNMMHNSDGLQSNKNADIQQYGVTPNDIWTVFQDEMKNTTTMWVAVHTLFLESVQSLEVHYSKYIEPTVELGDSYVKDAFREKNKQCNNTNIHNATMNNIPLHQVNSSSIGSGDGIELNSVDSGTNVGANIGLSAGASLSHRQPLAVRVGSKNSVGSHTSNNSGNIANNGNIHTYLSNAMALYLHCLMLLTPSVQMIVQLKEKLEAQYSSFAQSIDVLLEVLGLMSNMRNGIHGGEPVYSAYDLEQMQALGQQMKTNRQQCISQLYHPIWSQLEECIVILAARYDDLNGRLSASQAMWMSMFASVQQMNSSRHSSMAVVNTTQNHHSRSHSVSMGGPESVNSNFTPAYSHGSSTGGGAGMSYQMGAFIMPGSSLPNNNTMNVMPIPNSASNAPNLSSNTISGALPNPATVSQPQIPIAELVLYKAAMQLALDATVAEWLGNLKKAIKMYNHANSLLQCLSFSLDKLYGSINISSTLQNNITGVMESDRLINSRPNFQKSYHLDLHVVFHFMDCLNQQQIICSNKLNATT